jgi:hypothetical protein
MGIFWRTKLLTICFVIIFIISQMLGFYISLWIDHNFHKQNIWPCAQDIGFCIQKHLCVWNPLLLGTFKKMAYIIWDQTFSPTNDITDNHIFT